MKSALAAVAIFLLFCAAKPPSPPPLRCLDERGRPAADALRPVHLDAAMTRPKLVREVKPDFQKLPLRPGMIIIEAIIDRRGRICATRVLRGSGSVAETALAALRQWRFEPALKDGKPVPVFYVMTFHFCPH